MSKFIITGASGMLGSALCKQLVRYNEVYGIDIRALPDCAHLCGFKNIDITNTLAVEDFVNKIKPDVLIHTAAYTDVDGCELNPGKAVKINAEGTKVIAQACANNNVLMVFISTDYIFDGKKETFYTEKDIPNPVNIYGKAKLAGEAYVKDLCSKFLIVRTSGVFGSNGKNFVNTVLQLVQNNKQLRIVDDQMVCPTYTVDLSAAIINLLSSFKNKSIIREIYNITNSGSCSWFEFTNNILQAAGIDKKVLPVKYEELNRPAARPKVSMLSSQKYVENVGKPLRHWSEALKEYIKGK